MSAHPKAKHRELLAWMAAKPKKRTAEKAVRACAANGVGSHSASVIEHMKHTGWIDQSGRITDAGLRVASASEG